VDWSVVNDYFRIGIKIVFFSLFFNLSQQTVRTAYILASDGRTPHRPILM
jgi:hypothetical protein